MASIVIMPKQGLMMTEGTITNWLKKEGEEVVAGTPLFEMETDKLTITMDAEVSGTMLKILHPAGDVVPITEPIAIVGEAGPELLTVNNGMAVVQPLTNQAPQAAAQAPILITVQSVLDGRVIAESTTKYQERAARMHG